MSVGVVGVSKSYGARGTVRALSEIDLEVCQGELLVLLGPSGCGKSTLLRCIAGLETPESGTISLGTERVFDAKRVDVPPNRRDIGFVFQNYVLWPHMTVRQNVAYPLKARHRPNIESRVADILEVVRCAALARRYPRELSGGQQQRVAVARALAAEPSVLLLDEPLSNLDALLREELRAQLREIHERLGYTGIHVTHDQLEALNLGTRIGVMEAGRLVQVATPQELHEAPATLYVAEFLGVRNRLPLARLDGRWETPIGPLDAYGWLESADTGEHTLGLRPEHVQLDRAGSYSEGACKLGSGRVVEVLYGGETVDYRVQAADTLLTARSFGGSTAYNVGDDVHVSFDPRKALVYVDNLLVPNGAPRPVRL